MGITIMYLYYNQPEALKHLEQTGLPSFDCKKVIVDDASDVPLVCDWAKVHRIDIDVPWNQPAACNFGFSRIDDSETVLRMDIDHWVMESDFELLGPIDHGVVVQFDRVCHLIDGSTTDVPMANGIYMARLSTIKEIGGYDESYCGSYGYDDKELIYRLKKNGCKFVKHPSIKIHVKIDYHTKKLNRDTSVNKARYMKLIESDNQG